MSTPVHNDTTEPLKPSNFLRQIIDADLAQGTHANNRWAGTPGDAAHQQAGALDPARIRTRFPPEPNGYLHVGHAKSICLNFGLARDYGGVCHLRFDDTNPEKEEQEYVDAIIDAVHWLGFDWKDPDGHENLYFASNYFDFMYRAAEYLIESGNAYVDEQTAEEMRANRGDFGKPGVDSPYRGRTPAAPRREQRDADADRTETEHRDEQPGGAVDRPEGECDEDQQAEHRGSVDRGPAPGPAEQLPEVAHAPPRPHEAASRMARGSSSSDPTCSRVVFATVRARSGAPAATRTPTTRMSMSNLAHASRTAVSVLEEPVTTTAIEAPGSRSTVEPTRSPTPPRVVCSTTDRESRARPGVTTVSSSRVVSSASGDSA